MTVLLSDCPHHMATNVKSHFSSLISSWYGSLLHIHVAVNWQLSKQVSADQYHMTISRAQVSSHLGLFFFEVICWQATSF